MIVKDSSMCAGKLFVVEQENSEVAVEKTIRYLAFFTLLGFCMFYGQKVVTDRNRNGAWITWFRNTTIISLCCTVPSRRSKKTPTEDDSETQVLKTGSSKSTSSDEDFDVQLLFFCVIGLVGSYLAWGYFQERIMTRPYESTSTGKLDKFKDAEFLVFCNRIAGLVIGRVGMEMTGPHEHFAPPFSFSFCSMSNILSSWFQYEALKFITFPMQVLSKSCKIIAAMMMGKLLNGSTFTYMEIFNAFVITAGLFVFKYGQSQGKTDDEEMSEYFMLGMFLISCYIAADSFTSNWQQRVYSQYPIHSFQMMVGVNMFSSTISVCLCAPRMWDVKAFVEDHPTVLIHMTLMSACSALGQLFIFYTIKKFGAVVFATAMTSRSILSVLISISIFGHSITPIGAFGLCISFSGLIWKVWLKRAKSLKKKAAKAAARQRNMDGGFSDLAPVSAIPESCNLPILVINPLWSDLTLFQYVKRGLFPSIADMENTILMGAVDMIRLLQSHKPSFKGIKIIQKKRAHEPPAAA